MRLGLLLTLIVAAVAAVAAPPASAADVTVVPDGGEPVTLSIAELEPSWDVRDRPYTLRGPDGEQPLVVTGISIDRLLDRAGVDPFGFAGATVTLGDRSVALSRDQLIDTEAFPEGRPVFSADAEGTHFLRPVTGPGDLNLGDRLSTADGTITVALAAGGALRVSAEASRERVRERERVTFQAFVEGAAEGEEVRVRWTFGDGTSATGTRVRHRFKQAGTYRVIVGATSDENPTGASAIVTIRVGEAADEETSEPDDSPAGDESSEEDGAGAGGGTPSSGAGGGPSGAATASSGAVAGEAAARRRAAARRAARTTARRRREARPRDERPAGEPVSGVLLDDTGSLPEVAAPASARTPSQGAAATPDALRLPPEALAGLGALLLLGYGARRERRGRLAA